MNRFLKRAWAEIDLDALEHNYNEIKNSQRARIYLPLLKPTLTVTMTRRSALNCRSLA